MICVQYFVLYYAHKWTNTAAELQQEVEEIEVELSLSGFPHGIGLSPQDPPGHCAHGKKIFGLQINFAFLLPDDFPHIRTCGTEW